MKQVLIEKYIEPSEKEGINSVFVYEFWLNKYGDRHSFMGQPAYIVYDNGKIKRQIWYKKGIVHRDRDLPAYIEYNNGQIIYKEWYKKGKCIKREARF
jgi:antitoxin component YwqK of YwqJK toxin-antitoxin module